MIDQETEFDYSQCDAAVVQFRDRFELPIFAFQSARSITLLHRGTEQIWRSTDGSTGVRQNCDVSFLGRESQLSQRGDGRSRAAIIIGALLANSVSIELCDDRFLVSPVECRGKKWPH